ncbi:hypothetical protein [Stenotrophomonas phage BUCT627]|uniref:Uncharacterized protein n=2 Tax=Bixiavirus TaxID=3044676 RepID=A0AC61N9V2_9CAUD|nr:hypothetical protein PQD76_gp43 [Stenotrophomonas phage BUCT626]YP_010677432.1 hypothetical protein PQD77_gp026 [Stenotrophomonas phage BUCT627]QYC96632.1 hypothetical protein [Stenotrophomonas phage BUCT627]QYC96747.1 hypothetical protein [Stenotrophomonas phage BUCT626]
MDLKFNRPDPKLLIVRDLVKGQVYRRYDHSGGRWIPTDSYYIASRVGQEPCAYLVNLRNGNLMLDDVSSTCRFELTEAHVVIGEDV